MTLKTLYNDTKMTLKRKLQNDAKMTQLSDAKKDTMKWRQNDTAK
jgi:hypothetical protein